MLSAGADMTQTTRIKMIKARILASYRKKNPRVAEFGPGGQTTPESVRTTRSQGQMPLVRMTGGPKIETLPPCGCENAILI
jgi:hypothetical protein